MNTKKLAYAACALILILTGIGITVDGMSKKEVLSLSSDGQGIGECGYFRNLGLLHRNGLVDPGYCTSDEGETLLPPTPSLPRVVVVRPTLVKKIAYYFVHPTKPAKEKKETPVSTVTPSATDTPTLTPTETPTATNTPTETAVPTETTEVPTGTAIPTETPSPTSTPTETVEPTKTPPPPTPTETPKPIDTPEPTDTPEATETPKPTKTPKPTDTPEPTGTHKPHCDKGGGNGSEGCDQGNNPDNGHDDEDDDKKDDDTCKTH